MAPFRNWLMHIVAGKQCAFWISDKAESAIDGLGLAGQGAAIVLAKQVERMRAEYATFTLSGGWRITVEKIGESEP